MQTNQVVIKIVTTAIVSMAVVCVITVCWLSYKGIQVPPELNTLTGGLVGACCSMLVKTSPTEVTKVTPPDSPPPVVQIANPPENPVPVVEQPNG